MGGIDIDKRIGIGIGILLIVAVVAFSGCTSSTPKETLVKDVNVSSMEKVSAFGTKGVIFDIPDNASNVRVVYNLTAGSSFGMGSNGNLGVSSDNIDPNSGQSPIGFDNEYLEAGPGKTIYGEKNFTSSHGSFYYGGSFVSGNIKVYVTE